ncbi:MAG: alpha-E domain-containing protein [Bacteroidota bacterium]
MLSRVADSLYWMSRYLERAEHTARVLDVNRHGLLDQKTDVTQKRWTRVLRSLRVDLPDAAPSNLARTVALDPALPDSIVRCVAAARQNAREVREEISSEMWEQINRLHLFVRAQQSGDDWENQAHGFFHKVKHGSHLFQGLTDSTMSHNEGWQFIQLGRYLERVAATVNLLDAHVNMAALSNGNGRALPSHSQQDWAGLLKSCTALEAYSRVHTANIQPDRAVEFLLLDAAFPHSVRFGSTMVERALDALADGAPTLKHSDLLRTAGRLTSATRFYDLSEMIYEGLPSHLDQIRGRCERIHQGVYDTFITYTVEFAVSD